MKYPHTHYLAHALLLARDALEANNFPIGAVLVNTEGHVIGADRNRNAETNHRLQHAEMRVLHEAHLPHASGDTTLTLYSSLEPCPMCFGAAAVARIERIVWACRDPFGGAGIIANLWPWPHLRVPELIPEPDTALQTESHRLLMDYFTHNQRDDLLAAWRPVSE
jgi:tRNA(adenine34) deaminase